jgi:hypothetical protein
VTGDDVYGAGPGLRAEFETSGIGYVLAVAVAGRRWTIEMCQPQCTHICELAA